MIDDELLSKLDSIEDLPISEEMLGAYLEGNLDFYESSEIKSLISDNMPLANFCQEISDQEISYHNLESETYSQVSVNDFVIDYPIIDSFPKPFDALDDIMSDNSFSSLFLSDIILPLPEDFKKDGDFINTEDSGDGDFSSDHISFDNMDQ